MKKILLFLILLSLFGCASMASMEAMSIMSQQDREQYTIRQFPYDFEKVFETTKNTFSSMGFSLAYIDKDSGIIRTDSRSTTVFLFQQRVNAQITKINEQLTKVQLFVFHDNVESQNHDFHISFLNAIEENLKK